MVVAIPIIALVPDLGHTNKSEEKKSAKCTKKEISIDW
jgi:hypothetical protein